MADATVYIQKEDVDHLNLINDTGAELSQFEFTVIGGLCLIADEVIASAARGSFHVEEDLVVQFDATNDGVSGELTFGTADAIVYWKPSTGEFSDTATAGYYKVGIVHTVKNTNGIVLFVKARDAVLLATVPSGEVGWIEYEVAADATTAVSNDFGFNFEILDAFVHSTASNASATIQLLDSSDNAITDAIVAAVVLTVTRVGTIDGETNDYASIADGIVKFIANGAADRGIVRLLVKAA